MSDAKEPTFPLDPESVRALLHAAFGAWDRQFKARYLTLVPHVRALGLEIGSENDYIHALMVTPFNIFVIQFTELETFVFVHALNALNNPSDYPKQREDVP